MVLPLIGSSGGWTKPHRLLPFLRFSTLYPKMLVPPVLVGAVQAKLMQSLKALTIFGVEGGPGNAGKRNEIIRIGLFCSVTNACYTLVMRHYEVGMGIVRISTVRQLLLLVLLWRLLISLIHYQYPCFLWKNKLRT